MSNPTPYEEEALAAASVAAGEYMESIGKADFFTHITPDEWDSMIDAAVFTFTDALAQLTGGPKSQEADALAKSIETDILTMDLGSAVTTMLEADLKGRSSADGCRDYLLQMMPYIDKVRLEWRRYLMAVGDKAQAAKVAPEGIEPGPSPFVPVQPSSARLFGSQNNLIEDDEIPF